MVAVVRENREHQEMSGTKTIGQAFVKLAREK